jgi:hypothetical protein
MSALLPILNEPPSTDRDPVRVALLLEARGVADAALTRMRRLHRDFPDAVTAPVLAQLGQPDERRRAVRLHGHADRVAIRTAGGWRGDSEVHDYCPGGLNLHLSRPVPCGSLLRVRPADTPGNGWLLLAVRHCRNDGARWALGCEVVGVERDRS